MLTVALVLGMSVSAGAYVPDSDNSVSLESDENINTAEEKSTEALPGREDSADERDEAKTSSGEETDAPGDEENGAVPSDEGEADISAEGEDSGMASSEEGADTPEDGGEMTIPSDGEESGIPAAGEDMDRSLSGEEADAPEDKENIDASASAENADISGPSIAVLMPDILKINGAEGNSFSIPFSIKLETGQIPGEKEDSFFIKVKIPPELKVLEIRKVNTVSDGNSNQEPLAFHMEDGEVRIDWHELYEIPDSEAGDCLNAEIVLCVSQGLEPGEQLEISVEAFILRELDNDDSVVIVGQSVCLLEAETGTPLIVPLYEGEENNMISSGRKAVSILVPSMPGVEKAEVSWGSVYLYYSPQASSENMQVYIGLTGSETDMSAQVSVKTTGNCQEDILIGDANGDGLVNAQDVQDILDIWLRNKESWEISDKQILSMNTNGDGQIDINDALAAVDYIVNGRMFDMISDKEEDCHE